MNDKTEVDGSAAAAEDQSEKEWNERRVLLEDVAKNAAMALLNFTASRAVCIPFVGNDFAMVVAVGLPVDVIATTAESMKMFMHKHNNSMDAMAVLTGQPAKFQEEGGEDDPEETAH